METIVKTYDTPGAYESGLKQMQADGWRSVNVVEKRPVRGCLALFPARSHLVVTYERNPDELPPHEMAKRSGQCPNCGNAISPSAYFCPSCRVQLRS